MDARVHSLLYDRPALYDLVFPDASETTLAMCLTAFSRWLAVPPQSVLDVGCGTGRELERLSRTIPECWGVDFLESNVAYARKMRLRLVIRQGDMRTIRLGRTFDAIVSLGNPLSYALTDEDLGRTLSTFAAHSRSQSLLIFDVLNARCYLDGNGFQERIEARVDVPGFAATTISIHTLDRSARLLKRKRTWLIPGQPDVEDYAEYRLLYPEEARQLVEGAGFEWLAGYDNRVFRESDLTGSTEGPPGAAAMHGRKLYAFARKR
ncbi:MAG: class I SAM-dependent methyltransferase [Candidatus Coatesbacteria bacterium]